MGPRFYIGRHGRFNIGESKNESFRRRICSLGLTQDLQGAATGRLAYLPPSPPGPPNPPPAPPSPPSPPPAAKY